MPAYSIIILTLALPFGLQLYRRRSAVRGLERGPNRSAGGPQADSRNPGIEREKQSSSASPLSHLQLNDISLSFI